ncbi:hypothetical protein EV191_101237 [Tamaricihabitans halophyticus]|uniref:Uncharacterized protein n=1 Tax=Tamaricihabitans halophyticus TaxID=1262583 RepID=A0A4V2SUX0_9PSEU|nr:hypothetical protein [Tamaricihabitans halophyticus]TCP56296.1 hypothetical protein EV191_101237 [Tamaricihabitans halophyticus]
MIEQDRLLLARAMQVNQELGKITIELMDHQDGGELPAEPLRKVGEHLRRLGVDMLARAGELDGRPLAGAVVEPPADDTSQ